MRKSTIAFYLFIFSCIHSLQAQKFEIAPLPDWVVPVDPMVESKVSKYDVNNGVYSSLVDYQIHFETEADYTHGTMKIVSSAGISNASELYIAYDTTYQNVLFHTLNIWRNGKKIDRLNDLEFEFLSNEQNLGQGIYTGAVTAYEILQDIRKDDIVEYAYTIVGDNPIYEGKSFRILPLEDTNPIDKVFLRIIYPKDNKHYYECRDCGDVELKESSDGGSKIIELSRINIEAKDIEETMPAWHIPYSHFVISRAKDWQEVNDWALQVFDVAAEADLTEVFEEALTGDENEEEKINKLLDYVQNDIRYMGIEAGIGSIQPFPPNQVVTQRYGDCKDKTVLFISLLKAIGIETAYPALVNTSLLQGVDSLLPSAQMFDHVIVCFDYDGERYWIDPTIILQGGDFKHKYIADYGLALVVKEGNTSLTEMKINDQESRTEVEEYLTIEAFDEPAKFKVVSRMYGQNADNIRAMFEYYSVKEASDELRNIYANIFPTITEADRLQVEDNMEENVVTLTETYTIPDLWREEQDYSGQVRVFQYEPIPLYSYVGPITCEAKEHPVQIAFPSTYIQQTVISLPIDLNLNMETQLYRNGAFDYSRKAMSLSNNTIQINYQYKALAKSIEASEYQVMCKQLNEIAYDLPFKITYPINSIPPPPPSAPGKRKKRK